jgi:ribosomal protein S18 acetylase RimI-like enzyme
MTAERDTGRVSIRPAVASDAETIVEFRLAMFDDIASAEARGTPGADPVRRDTERRDNARWVAEHLGRDFFAWFAETDGRPVASAGLLWFAHPPGRVNTVGREAYILNVYTKPEARRRGIARALMEKVVKEARSAGARRIWLRASDEGRPLYESMGFRPGGYLELKTEEPTA